MKELIDRRKRILADLNKVESDPLTFASTDSLGLDPQTYVAAEECLQLRKELVERLQTINGELALELSSRETFE